MILQKRGPIIDIIWNKGVFRFRKPATVICKHLKMWPEGDEYEEYGGKACQSCCESNRQK